MHAGKEMRSAGLIVKWEGQTGHLVPLGHRAEGPGMQGFKLPTLPRSITLG